MKWRGLGLKCPHIRNPHIRDMMGSFSTSMQNVSVFVMYDACTWGGNTINIQYVNIMFLLNIFPM